MNTPEQVLKASFGYESFKEGQKELIDHILAGQDTLGIMPTGAGKSLCYQVPALMMEGITLVISPLISLMNDQVRALVANGIRGAYFNSSLSLPQYRKALSNAKKGMYKIIYVAPERLLTPGFQDFVQSVNISMVAVDEAHCVSQWGQNFRPSYLQIAEFIQTLPKRPVVAAFTATATGLVKKDIENLLQLHNPWSITTGFDRPNLYFGVEKPRDRDKFVRDYVRLHQDDAGIIYCLTRRQVEEVHEMLVDAGFLASRYHAGLSEEERRKSQDDFQYDRTPIMVATSAFGMGIDKSNVRYVLHYAMPGSLEAYYQEAGRAGRDGAPGECILLYNGKDMNTHQFFLDHPATVNPDPIMQEQIHQQDFNRLMRMREYCDGFHCLRSYILEYFGQKVTGSCDNCSVCKASYTTTDVTEMAKPVYELITHLPRQYGISFLADLLKGSQNKRVKDQHLDTTPGFGAMHHLGKKQIQDNLEHLIYNGWLIRSNDEYRTISLSGRMRQAMQEHQKIEIREKSTTASTRRNASASMNRENPELFRALVQARMFLAAKEGVPPYIIFSDQTLHAMARLQPKSKEEMLMVPGIAELKFARYGKPFLQTIERFLQQEADSSLTTQTNAAESQSAEQTAAASGSADAQNA